MTLQTDLLELASNHLELDQVTEKRLELLLNNSVVVSAGYTEYLGEPLERYTTQINFPGLRRFADDSEEYEDLMFDLDTFEVQAEEPLHNMFWFYVLDEKTMKNWTMHIFFDAFDVSQYASAA